MAERISMADQHTHQWTYHRNVTSRGYEMSPYEACHCGAARQVPAQPDDADEERERAVVAWAQYRKDFQPLNLQAARKAFFAGWDAAKGQQS